MVNTGKLKYFVANQRMVMLLLVFQMKKSSLPFISPLLAVLLKENNPTTKVGGCGRTDIMDISCI